VGGCLVGPNYKRPTVDIPVDWLGAIGPENVPTSQRSAARQTAADVARWWTMLDDPVLESLIERATESNYDLQRAAARVRQARAGRGVAQSSLFPNVNTGGRFSRSGTGEGDEGGDDRIITLPDGTVTRAGGDNRSSQRSNYRIGLDAAWELDIFGGIRRDVEAADAEIRFAVEDHRDVLITLASEVALNYVDLRLFQRQIDIAVRNLESQERATDVTRRLAGVGLVSRLDLANANALVASTRSQIPSLETLERQAIYNLGTLIGREPGALVEELSHGGPLPAVPTDVPVGIPSDLLRRRPDIRRAEAAAHAATARVGVATADLFPRFSLTGSLGLQGDKHGSISDSRNYFWSYGPSISWPLFDAGRIRSNIGVQEASQEEALLAYRGTILLALQEVESALIAYVNEQERRQSVIVAVEESRRSVEYSLTLYANGQIEYLNVLTAQRALLNSEDALAQSDRTVVTNLIALYKALGGGWEATEMGAASD
jgi:NodT family efflux transporter outer membrane factor (OMF) lipoprotein